MSYLVLASARSQKFEFSWGRVVILIALMVIVGAIIMISVRIQGKFAHHILAVVEQSEEPLRREQICEALQQRLNKPISRTRVWETVDMLVADHVLKEEWSQMGFQIYDYHYSLGDKGA